MVQIEGKYTNDRNENLDEYFRDVGIPYIPRKMLCASRPTLEIKKQGDEWTISVSTLIRTNVTKFKLGEEYDEHMPGGILKNVTTLEGDKLVTKSVGPGDIKTTREYEFTDEECLITFTSEKSSQPAKRYYKRV